MMAAAVGAGDVFKPSSDVPKFCRTSLTYILPEADPSPALAEETALGANCGRRVVR